MGKMKEEFLNNREKEIIQEAIDAFMDDDYQLEEYYASMEPKECNGDCDSCQCSTEPVTMEELVKNHNDWWDSLTEEEKQKIADEAQAASTYFDEQRANRDE